MALKKDGRHRILKEYKEGTLTLDEHFMNQTVHIYNRTIDFGKAMKRHSGEYLLDEHTSDGKILKTVNVHLKIYGR